jgi:hypothetical protein
MVVVEEEVVVVVRKWRMRERVVEEIGHDEPNKYSRQTQI